MGITLDKGLDLDLPGGPAQVIDDSSATRRAALLGVDCRGIRPVIAVKPGDAVTVGQTLLTDRRHPELRIVAPVAGRIEAVRLGAKRSLRAIVIDTTQSGSRRPAVAGGASVPDAAQVRAALLDSGLWATLRARPFSVIPAPDAAPQAVTVSLIDSQPWAPEPAVVIAGRERQLGAGLEALARLAPTVYVCKSPSLTLELPTAASVVVVDIAGPHPSGLPGTQIERLAPARADRQTWYAGYQDVLAIGELFLAGTLSHERVVALAGPGAKRPRLIRTHVGAAIDELLAGEIEHDATVIAGSVLSGRQPPQEERFLGRYETQISVLRPHAGPDRAPTSRPASGMLPAEAFEAVWPLTAPPLVLLRALLAGDVETAEALGCLNLDEEDLALCACVCPVGIDYGAALRRTLEGLGGAA